MMLFSSSEMATKIRCRGGYLAHFNEFVNDEARQAGSDEQPSRVNKELA